jgi:hypothetical protein
MDQVVRRRTLKVSLIFGIALVALIVTWTALSDYVKRAENCFPELGQYGDQRLIDVAIEYEISRDQRKIDYDKAPGLIQYKSIEDFKARNEKVLHDRQVATRIHFRSWSRPW